MAGLLSGATARQTGYRPKVGRVSDWRFSRPAGVQLSLYLDTEGKRAYCILIQGRQRLKTALSLMQPFGLSRVLFAYVGLNAEQKVG